MKKVIKYSTQEHTIINKIFIIRGEKVMLDKDLAILYDVKVKVLKQSIKRNIERFPNDFMFELTKEEFNSLRSQSVTLNDGSSVRGKHSKYLPYVFTEQGVAMLSSILNSDRAIQVNIRIIRVYTKMRQFLSTHKDILLKLEQLERKTDSHDEKINLIFDYIKQLIQPKSEPRKQVGYKFGTGK